MPGPPPKPREQKRLLGNPGHQKLPAPVVTLPALAPGTVPPYPPGLRKPGKTMWDRLWRVGSAWLSPESDLGIMIVLCQGWDEREVLRRMIRRDGQVTMGSMGQMVSHPAVRQLRILEGQLVRWMGLCGFTPSDRSRLGLIEVSRVSKLEKFLERRDRHKNSRT